MRWIRLGLRLSLGSGRAGALRTGLMASGAAVGTLVVLATLAVPSVADAQRDRAMARTPIHAENAGDPATLRVREVEDVIGTRVLRRVVVAGMDPDSPLPPGLTAYPKPGEAIASPALANLIESDERARDRFPQRLAGLIAPAGLVAPDELRAYVGLPADDPYLADARPVVGFGRSLLPVPASIGAVDVFTPARAAGLGFALFVLVPLGVFLATCARLSASTRDRRIAALRLLGVSARQAAVVNAVETGVVAAAGAIVGYGLFRALAPLSQRWQVGRLHWYAADVAVAPSVIVGVLAAAAGCAVAIGVLATRPARVAPLRVRRDAPARRPGLWRLLPLAAGLALAIAAAVQTGVSTPDLVRRGAMYAGGVVLTGLGLPLALAPLGWVVAALVRQLPRAPVSWELTAARLRHAPGVAPRLVASLAVAVYVAGLGGLGTAVVANRLGITLADEGIFQPSPVYTTQLSDPDIAAEIGAIDGVDIAGFARLDPVDGTLAGILVASCADIAVLYRIAPGDSCVDGASYRLDVDILGEDGPGAGAEIRTEQGVRLVVPDEVLHLRAKHRMALGAGILVTTAAPVLAGHDVPRPSYDFIVGADRDALDRVARVISARTPANILYGEFGAERGLDGPLLSTILTAGLVVSLGLGLASFAAAATDRHIERRRGITSMALIGASPRTIAASEVGFSAVPLVLGLAGATAATVVVAVSLARLLAVQTDAVIEIVAPALWLGAGALLAGLALITLPVLATPRVTSESLRRT